MSLNAISVRQADIRTVVSVCAETGVGGVGVWRHHVEADGAAKIRRWCEDHGLRISSLCRGGMFPADSAAGRRAAVDDNRRAIADAAELGADVLVLVSGPVAGHDLPASRAMVAAGIEALLPEAQAAGVTLGIEPLHPMFVADRSVVVTLGEGNDLVVEFDSSALGLVVDVYHCWWDPRVHEEIRRAGGRIVGFHVSDWVVPLDDPLLSRGLPGDGFIDLRGLRATVESAGYTGLIEVEIMNEQLWSLPVDEAARACADRFLRHA